MFESLSSLLRASQRPARLCVIFSLLFLFSFSARAQESTIIRLESQTWPTSSAPAHQRPQNDYHQHLLSPAVAKLTNRPKPFLATDLIPLLDAAGIQHALILSLAYQFGNPNRPPVNDEYTFVKAENDWTADQVSAFPRRLAAACGVDPLRDYAVTEIQRCSLNPFLRSAIKLHFGNSDVDLDNPAHIQKLQRVFREANAHGMVIIVHLHANVNNRRPYGKREAEAFLTQVLPAAPDVAIQIAHLAGSGGFDDPATRAALQGFIDAITRHDTRVSHLCFDISGVAGLGDWTNKKDLIVAAIRSVGVTRILFGSDGAWTDFTPSKAISAFRELPLTEQEFQAINSNVPPYLTVWAEGPGPKPPF